MASGDLDVTVVGDLEDALSVDRVLALLAGVSLAVPAGAVDLRELGGLLPDQHGSVEGQDDLALISPAASLALAGFWLAAKAGAAAGDAEGGLWVWEAGDATAADGFSVLESEAPGANGRWRRVTAARPALPDGAATTATFDSQQVTTEKLADGAVTAAKILAGEVETADFAGGAVVAAKLAESVTVDVVFDSGWLPAVGYFQDNQDMDLAHGLAGVPQKVTVWFRLGAAKAGFAAGDAVRAEAFRRFSLVWYATPGAELVSADTVPMFAVAVDFASIKVESSGRLSKAYMGDVAGAFRPYPYTTGAAKLTAVDLTDAQVRVVARLR